MSNAAIINQLLAMKSRSNDLTSQVVEVYKARDDLKVAILHLCLRVVFLDDLKDKEALTDKVFNKAYKVIALRIHPDKNADNADNASAAFKKLQTALEILNLSLELHDDEQLKEALQHKEMPAKTAVPIAAPSGAAAGGGAASNPQPPQYQQGNCFSCGDPSHRASFCPKRRAAAVGQKFCFKCGDPSHMANTCPLRRAATASGGGASAYPSLCRNGKHCVFHMMGRCKFGHPE